MSKRYQNIIELDIWGNFGCFTKGFATSGGVLTYFLPPKTSLIGMIGAVLGIDYDSYTKIDENHYDYEIEELYDIKVSIQPLFDLSTKRVTFNNVSQKITNIHQDVLINPYYKIFLSFPTSLKEKEEIFIDRIKNNKTIYSLYMGRNEFPLNYELKNISPYNSKFIDSNSIDDFLSEDVEIYGTLNKNLVKNTNLVNFNNDEIVFSFMSNEPTNLPSYFEYVIRDFPIKRENFTHFTYLPISFFSSKKDEKIYFNNFELKEGCEIEMVNVGGNKWITLI